MKKRINWPFLFIAPFFIIYGIFNLFPILFSFYISLTKWKGFGPMEFIGLDNYVALLQDKAFYRSVFNSFMIVLEAMIPIQTLGLILALLMNYGIIKIGKGYIRNTMFLPYITAPIAIGLIFATLFDQNFGAVNLFLKGIGVINKNVNTQRLFQSRWWPWLQSGAMWDIRQSFIWQAYKASQKIFMKRPKWMALQLQKQSFM